MDGRRSTSRRHYRLLLRVYAAENLKHVSSQGTYCKIYVDENEMTRGSHGQNARASLKRLLNQSSSSLPDRSRESGFEPRIYKTQVQKSPQGKPVWNEKFEIPVFDPAHDVLSIRVKSARLMSAPAIGAGSVWLRDVSTDATWDRWISLFDKSKRQVGRLRIQMRLLPPASSSLVGEEDGDRVTMAHNMASPIPRAARRVAVVAPPLGGFGEMRRSTTLSQSLVEARTRNSTSASASISSDASSRRLSVPAVTPYTPSEDFDSMSFSSPVSNRSWRSPAPSESSSRRDSGFSGSSRFTGMSAGDRNTGMSAFDRSTGLSMGPRETEELDDLANKYMTKPTRASSGVPSRVSGRSSSYHQFKQPQIEEEPHADPRRSISNRELSSSNAADDLPIIGVCMSNNSPKLTPQDLRSSVLTPERLSLTSERSSLTSNQVHDPNPASSLVVSLMQTTDLSSSVLTPMHVPSTQKSKRDSPAASSSPAASPLPTRSESKLSNSSGSSRGAKDERSPRTTNTTAASSDEEEPQDETVEFDFDTGRVRPSKRLPEHIMRRATITRCSVATSRAESVANETAESESGSDGDGDDDDEQEDDEMDPDGAPDGPRMFLRATVFKLLGRDSVNVIMDVDEEDEDDDEFEMEPFVYDEFPMLDLCDSLLQVKDIDFTGRHGSPSSSP